MEDGIEQSMSFLIAELEKKQRTTKPKYEEQVHPIGLSLISVIDTTQDITPISVIDTTQDITPIGHDNTPIGRQEVCLNTGPNTGPKTGQDPLAKTTPNLPSTNTGSDS